MKPTSDITAFPDGSIAVGAASGCVPDSAAVLDYVPVSRQSTGENSRLRDLYELTKPRMNFLVVLTTAVGYFMAGRITDHWMQFVQTIVGTALTAAGASVLNQYSERAFDALMPRTANRPLPGGRMRPGAALLYGVLLGVAGVLYLNFLVNPLTAALGAITLACYVFVYTPMKRYSTLCTVVGAVPGAIPPLMGFTGCTGHLSPEALAVFGILFFWQMPHFLAIAILYRDDYLAGGFLMLPVVDTHLEATGRQIILYGLALIIVSLMPFGLQMTGGFYLLSALLLGLVFLAFGIVCAVRKTRLDARRLFIVSILYLPLLLATMMIDKI